MTFNGYFALNSIFAQVWLAQLHVRLSKNNCVKSNKDRHTLLAADHVSTLLSTCTSLMYAMRVLRAHGTPTTSLHDIFRATVVSRIQYASPAWSGMCSAADRARLDSLLRRGKRLGYCSEEVPAVDELFSATDDDFFSRIKNNSNHVLYSYLPEKLAIPYQLRNRSHDITLINKTRFRNGTDYLIRMLYKYSY